MNGIKSCGWHSKISTAYKHLTKKRGMRECKGCIVSNETLFIKKCYSENKKKGPRQPLAFYCERLMGA